MKKRIACEATDEHENAQARVRVFDLLPRMEGPERRKKLFLQFVPLWQSINGKNGRQSQYRRVIAMAAECGRSEGTATDTAARL